MRPAQWCIAYLYTNQPHITFYTKTSLNIFFTQVNLVEHLLAFSLHLLYRYSAYTLREWFAFVIPTVSTSQQVPKNCSLWVSACYSLKTVINFYCTPTFWAIDFNNVHRETLNAWNRHGQNGSYTTNSSVWQVPRKLTPWMFTIVSLLVESDRLHLSRFLRLWT